MYARLKPASKRQLLYRGTSNLCVNCNYIFGSVTRLLDLFLFLLCYPSALHAAKITSAKQVWPYVQILRRIRAKPEHDLILIEIVLSKFFEDPDGDLLDVWPSNYGIDEGARNKDLVAAYS